MGQQATQMPQPLHFSRSSLRTVMAALLNEMKITPVDNLAENVSN
jgi:hypothetical protein